ncbi:hypothetical protein BD413DRAFT_605453 [Trametes elegans]|nr:hypothetical protein BD413DRAFT_605453 [Trametes elegans]
MLWYNAVYNVQKPSSGLGGRCAAGVQPVSKLRAQLDVTHTCIIAGGGLTGLVVTNRLSAEGHSMLVVEAGPDSMQVEPTNVATDRNNITAEQCNWKYDALAEIGTALGWKIDSGRCIGGHSSINGMVPEPDALEGLGSKGWNCESLYPCGFRFPAACLRSCDVEHFHTPTNVQKAEGVALVPSLHNFDGPVYVSFPEPMRIPVGQQLDLSDRNYSALGSTAWTAWNDNSTGTNVIMRSSAAHSFLFAPDQQRPALTVLHGHKVLKVNFDGNIKATGVQFAPTNGGAILTATENKEVLLAAGSLARSGVGDRSILSQFGIDTIVDLPAVGRNLQARPFNMLNQDQPGTGTSALVNDANATNTNTDLIDNVNMFPPVIGPVHTDQVFNSDATNRSVELGSRRDQRALSAVDAGAMASLESALAVFDAQSRLVLEDKMPIAEAIGDSYPGVMTTVFWPLLPFFRGYVHINSSDPFAPAAITLRLLSDEFDLSVAVTVAKVRSMYTTAPFLSVTSDAFVDLPGDASDEDWAGWHKSTAYGASRWLGSASMLPRVLGGVVDNQLRVYGTKSLRVVDVSILPMPITSHTMPAAYAIPQKAADIILGKDATVG